MYTPGSRFYSDLVHTWAEYVCIHQLVLKPCSKSASMQYNCRWLIPINAHVTWWPRCSIDEVRVSHGSQPCHKGEFRHVSISARHMMWTESLWAFPESYNANDSWIVHSSNGGPQGDKRAHNSTIKVSFCTIIIRLCHCMIAMTTV